MCKCLNVDIKVKRSTSTGIICANGHWTVLHFFMLPTPTQTQSYTSMPVQLLTLALENSHYWGWGGCKVLQESTTLSCASSQETGMTITHGGFQNESPAFPPLLNKKNKKERKKKQTLELFQSRSATKWHGSVLHR